MLPSKLKLVYCHNQVKSGNIYFVKLKFGILRLLLSLDRLVMYHQTLAVEAAQNHGGGWFWAQRTTQEGHYITNPFKDIEVTLK